MSGFLWDDESWTLHRFNIADCKPSIAIIKTVSQAIDEDPVDLPPLANYTDPDALDQVLETTTEVMIQFEYHEADVLVVSSGETLTVRCNP